MLKDFLRDNFSDNSLTTLMLFVAVFAASLAILYTAKRLIVRRIKGARRAAEGSEGRSIPLEIERRIAPLLYCLAAYMSLQVLTLGAALQKIAAAIFLVALGFFAVRLIYSLVDILIDRHWILKDRSPAQLQTIKGISSILKVAIWGIALFILLDNLGVNITALLAGLGIGGIAIALAAQTILGDLFSCFVIYFDRPFEVGDYVSIDAFSGTIEHVGIKTTRIRSLSGEQLIFPNSDLTSSRLRNYKRMEKRRISFKVGVAYGTDSGALKRIPGIVEGIVKSIADTNYERTHFSSFGDYSLVFDVVYYVMTSDYVRYMDIQQEINLRLKREFEKGGIQFAYPTQTLYLRDPDAPGPASSRASRRAGRGGSEP
jgi:small-conductance mechanosensitive channel